MLKTLSQSENRVDRQATADVINVVCAADDAYAIPLAVTLRSMCDQLNADSQIQLFVLDGGISEKNWIGLRETLANEPLELNVIKPDKSLVKDLKVSHHISHTAYFRLLAAELLPDTIDRAIYLDSDLLIKDDIGHLWSLPLNDAFCLAAVDIACPYIDARLGSGNFRLSSPYLATCCPIRNYRQLGIDGSLEYFNSGVMVINLDRWREENVAERLLRCLHDNRKHVWCWDQYALNSVFAGQWEQFSPRWNQGAHTFEYPSAAYAPIDPARWTEMKENPAIVHFTTEFKPWHPHSDHPRSELFFDGLAGTAWNTWTPSKPQFSWRSVINRYVVKGMKQSTISARKISSIWA